MKLSSYIFLATKLQQIFRLGASLYLKPPIGCRLTTPFNLSFTKLAMDSIVIQIASFRHVGYAREISDLIEESAKKETGIAKRSPNYNTKN